MRKIVLYAFLILYAVYYLLVPVSLIYISSLIPINIKHVIGGYLLFSLLVVCFILILMTIYRASLARDICLNSKDIRFIDIHTISGVMLKTNLSYLPLIGFIFKSDKT